MMGCTLGLLPYWLATFLIDIALWVIVIVPLWSLFIIFRIPAFMDNKISTLYFLLAQGPSFVLFCYCISFLCSAPEAASRQLFVALCVALAIPVIIDFARQDFVDPVWLDWFYGLFPHIVMQRAFLQMFMRISFLREPLSYYWTENKNVQAFLIMAYVDIPVYILLLWGIERLIVKLGKRDASRSYRDYTQFFMDQKAKHPATHEAQELENLVRSGVPLAVRSMMFLDFISTVRGVQFLR
jgi:hypothetical protein